MFGLLTLTLWILTVAGCHSVQEALVFFAVLLIWTGFVQYIVLLTTRDLVASAELNRLTPRGFFSERGGTIRDFDDGFGRAVGKMQTVAGRAFWLNILGLLGLAVIAAVSWMLV